MRNTKVFTTPKNGELTNDDAVYYFTNRNEVHLLAISDGASGAIYSGIWADFLTKSFAQEYEFFEKDFPGWRDKNAKQWQEDHNSADLPWYVESKIEQGSAASLHGIIISLEENFKCRSYCIGDSCFFILRNNRIVKRIPNMAPDDFNNYPDLLKTTKGQLIEPKKEEFYVSDGDILLLMTDALAKWFIQEYDNYNEERYWFRLIEINSDQEFKEFLYSELERKRADGLPAIHNDDFTLLKYCFNQQNLATLAEGDVDGIPVCE